MELEVQLHTRRKGWLTTNGPPAVRCAWASLVFMLGLCLPACTSLRGLVTDAGAWRPEPGDVASPQGLPEIGKWMLNSQNEPARWMGELYREKSLQEPINIIIVDSQARSAEEARERLVRNLEAAGYPSREGHSAGYRGYVDGVVYEQLPAGGHRAFANEPFELGSNHGRMFGPHPRGDTWLFIGAFSREGVDPLDKVKHRYVSFNRARDDLSQHLDMKTALKITAFVNLGNALIGDAVRTTGDHDGIAVLLTTARP